VACTIEYGIGDAVIRASWAIRPEVPALRQALGAHDRQGDVVADAGLGGGVEQRAGGGLEEVEHGGVLERRRVGDIDDDLRAGEHGVDAFAGDRVDARVR
jgi:hypothetical protein